MENKLAGFLFNKVGIEDYQKFLDISSLQHKLTAGNVANVDTPGYKARSIDFESELKRVRNESGHLSGTLTAWTQIGRSIRKSFGNLPSRAAKL